MINEQKIWMINFVFTCQWELFQVYIIMLKLKLFSKYFHVVVHFLSWIFSSTQNLLFSIMTIFTLSLFVLTSWKMLFFSFFLSIRNIQLILSIILSLNHRFFYSSLTTFFTMNVNKLTHLIMRMKTNRWLNEIKMTTTSQNDSIIETRRIMSKYRYKRNKSKNYVERNKTSRILIE